MAKAVLPTLYRCTHCGQIEPAADWRPFAHGVECIHCSVRKRAERWPKPEILELLDFCRTYDHGSPQHIRIVSVLLCVAFELMLEHLVYLEIYSLGYWGDKESIVIDPLIDAYRGRARLLTLARKIGYSELPGRAANRRQKSFFRNWHVLTETRNKAVHGKLDKRVRLPLSTVRSLITESLFVFSRFNNLYNRESIEFKTAKNPIR